MRRLPTVVWDVEDSLGSLQRLTTVVVLEQEVEGMLGSVLEGLIADVSAEKQRGALVKQPVVFGNPPAVALHCLTTFLLYHGRTRLVLDILSKAFFSS